MTEGANDAKTKEIKKENILEWREEHIEKEFGQSYDQPKTTEGFKDDDYDNHDIYRYITKWYLIKDRSKKLSYAATPLSENFSRRCPLPSNNKFLPCHRLHGLLEPPNIDSKPIPVAIHSLKIWVIDRSNSGRGIWVESSNAWYKLKEPCIKPIAIKVKVKTELEGESHLLLANLPSQSDIHLGIRAKFGLLSNIIDLLSERYTETADNYLSLHIKRSLQSIHSLLSPSDTILEKYNKPPESYLFSEPFDLQLLETCPGFIWQHILDLYPKLNQSCPFMKSLESMEKKSVKSKSKIEYTNEMYRKSAETSEMRGNRTAYGDINDVNRKVTPNRLIEIQLSHAAKNEPIDMKNDIERPITAMKEIDDRIDVKAISINDVSTTFSKSKLLDAEQHLNAFLNEEKAIKESEISNFPKVLQETSVHSLEYMWIIIKALRASSKKVMKSMFKNSAKGGRAIFIGWWECLMDILNDRIENSSERFTGDESVVKVATELMNLICDFNVIKEAKQVKMMKDKFEVDWCEIVKESYEIARKLSIDNLSEASEKAINHLISMNCELVVEGFDETHIKPPVVSQNSSAADKNVSPTVKANNNDSLQTTYVKASVKTRNTGDTPSQPPRKRSYSPHTGNDDVIKMEKHESPRKKPMTMDSNCGNNVANGETRSLPGSSSDTKSYSSLNVGSKSTGTHNTFKSGWDVPARSDSEKNANSNWNVVSTSTSKSNASSGWKVKSTSTSKNNASSGWNVKSTPSFKNNASTCWNAVAPSTSKNNASSGWKTTGNSGWSATPSSGSTSMKHSNSDLKSGWKTLDSSKKEESMKILSKDKEPHASEGSSSKTENKSGLPDDVPDNELAVIDRFGALKSPRGSSHLKADQAGMVRGNILYPRKDSLLEEESEIPAEQWRTNSQFNEKGEFKSSFEKSKTSWTNRAPIHSSNSVKTSEFERSKTNDVEREYYGEGTSRRHYSTSYVLRQKSIQDEMKQNLLHKNPEKEENGEIYDKQIRTYKHSGDNQRGYERTRSDGHQKHNGNDTTYNEYKRGHQGTNPVYKERPQSDRYNDRDDRNIGNFEELKRSRSRSWSRDRVGYRGKNWGRGSESRFRSRSRSRDRNNERHTFDHYSKDAFGNDDTNKSWNKKYDRHVQTSDRDEISRQLSSRRNNNFSFSRDKSGNTENYRYESNELGSTDGYRYKDDRNNERRSADNYKYGNSNETGNTETYKYGNSNETNTADIYRSKYKSQGQYIERDGHEEIYNQSTRYEKKLDRFESFGAQPKDDKDRYKNYGSNLRYEDKESRYKSDKNYEKPDRDGYGGYKRAKYDEPITFSSKQNNYDKKVPRTDKDLGPSLLPSRGRGRGNTLPAWMTSSNTSNSAPANRYDSNGGTSMTRSVYGKPSNRLTENNSKDSYLNFVPSATNVRKTNPIQSSKDQNGSHNRNETQVRRPEQGLGRGKNVNLPAWMTKTN